MAVKNFVYFRQDWFSRMVAGIKKTFFCHFWPNLDKHFATHPQKAQIRNSLNSILVNKAVYYYQLCYFKTD